MLRTAQQTQKPERKKAKIRPQAAKAKGRNLQKWVCEQISILTGFPWGKDTGIESRGMGQSGTDVRMEPCVLEKFPFSVECKWQESWSVPRWIEQARKNTAKGTTWLLVCKRSRNNPVVVIDAEEFFKLLKKIQ